MNEMKQHIVKLEEDLAAARAAGPMTPPVCASPVAKEESPNLEHLSFQSPEVPRDGVMSP